MRRDKFYLAGAAELMPMETPPLRVSRPVAACQRCRQAKIRCDGKLPACTACEKSGRAKQCSSTNSQFAPGKERSYVATLEAKVERLQKRIGEAKKRRKSSLSMLDVASPITPLSGKSAFDSIDRRRDRRLRFKQELSCIDELVSDFGFLTVNATARDLTYNFTHSISYAKLILSAATKEPLPSGMKKDLSPESVTDDTALVKLYVDSLSQIVPILDDTHIWRSWHAVSGKDENATAMDYWTSRLILAIASAMQSQQRGDTKYFDALGHICAAMVVADQVLHPGSIYSIQAMVLLVQYSMLDPSHFDSWTLIGATSRAMIDLGLHQDPSKSSNTPREKLELRRRVYHSVYIHDRSTSIVQTRALSFSDDSANVGLPFQRKPNSPSPTSSNKGNMWTRSYDVSRANLRIRQIQSAWYTKLFQSTREPMENPYSYIWKVYDEMTEWFNTLPANTSPQIRNFFEFDLLYSYVYILSPSPACPQPSEHAQRLVIEHCTTYSRKISNILSTPPKANIPSPFTFYDALRVYMMGRVFVDTLLSNLDALLQPSPRTPSAYSSNPGIDAELDPLFAAPSHTAPTLPTPDATEYPPSPVARAIETIEMFQSILSTFGMRFGYISGLSWRDKFQQEAAPLLSQLQQRQHMPYLSSPPDSSTSYFWTSPSHANHSSISSSATAATAVGAVNASSAAPHHQQVVGTSPASVSFYPSPPATQYSPPYVAPEAHEALNGAGWFGANEFGIDNLAAWKTLPGGSMNARFS